MLKIPIDFDGMKSIELLTLARKCIREFNGRELDQYKVMLR